jgi:uncharacterized membrane protein
MTWSTAFRIREGLRGSLWVVPLIGAVAGGLLSPLGILVDDHVEVSAYWNYSPSTASTLLSAIIGASAALTGFVVTVTVLVIQMSTGTFSARYMRLSYRDRLLKAVLAVLAATMAFAFQILRRVEDDSVPNVGVTVSGLMLLISLILFLIFFDRFVHRLRPVAVAAIVSRAGREAFEDACAAAAAPDAPQLVTRPLETDRAPTLVVHSPQAGSIQAVNGPGLVRWAREHRCLVVLPHAVGDFVQTDGTLVVVHGDAPADAPAQLRGLIALGAERTIGQDPAFAVRIMVDMANKALSAAINDPTTAVQAIDHLGDLLRLIGSTPLPVSDSVAGPGSVVIRGRTWEEFLAQGVTEIREYGATSMQVSRRLRALLEELWKAVLPENRAAVEDELARLEAAVSAKWSDSPDRDRSELPDRQGIGGPTATVS